MASKWFVRGACAAAAALLGFGGAAQAATTWNISGTFNDGGTLSGTITLNDYDFLQDDFTLTTTAGSVESGFTYTAANSFYSNTNPSYVSLPIYIDFQPGYTSELHVQFANDLGVSAPTDAIIGGYQSFECLNSFSCPNGGNLDNYAVRYLTEGQATLASAAPEPATWAFMMLGIGGIGGALRMGRRQRVTAVA